MFVNLHRHSRWSLLDGSGSGDQYAKRAVELGQHALALTDHGTLAGALEHVAACSEHGIMPIMGCEVYFRDNRLVRELVPGKDKNGKNIKKLPKRFHLTLLAMNFRGWLNLQRLTSEAYQTGLINGSDRPCIDWDVAARYNEGIYCLLGCYASVFSQDLLAGGIHVDSIIGRFRSIYGERLSIEIMPHDFDEQRRLNIDGLNVGNQYGIPVAATGDTHYPFKSWASTQDILLKLKTGQTNNKAKKKRDSGEDVYTMLQENPTLYLMGEQDIMREFLIHHPGLPCDVTDSAIAHTTEILAGFTPFYLDRDIKMPRFTREILAKIDPVTAYEDTEDPDEIVRRTLRRWAREGLVELKKLYPVEHWAKFPVSLYETQVEHELDTFDKVGAHVWRYMLMVAGEIRYARSADVVVGPGRGSAAGSTVAYLIGITDIDPISYGLMFERFINENRKGMPDIDVDFMPGARGRDKVQAHTAEVYDEPNAKNVINIAAYGTYGPKAALRAVCRVFDDVIDYPTADAYVKVLDALKPTDKIDLEECAERFEQINEFKGRFKMLWEQAVRIEGHPYTQSVHASGVLVKPSDVQVPTATKFDSATGEWLTVTAWPDTKETLANYGFLKIDYLVIDGLVRQYEIIKALRERDNTPIDLRRLPVRWDPFAVDPGVMRNVFHKATTLGVWQLEGRGSVPVLKAVKPDNMHELAAILALIRPGSRQAGDTEMYAKIKHGIEPLTYWHDAVEPVLKNTFGLMVYQEQVMEVAVQLGGFTRTEADDLRKAMGKKYREGMAAVEAFLDKLGFAPKFIHNAALMVGEENAMMIWKKTLAKGGYSFCASHAYAYGLISYHDGLFKTLAPADFYAGYLSSSKSKDLPMKLSGSMREGARFGVRINPPDINNSGYGFSVLDRKTILYGLEAVKNVGPTGVKAIFEHRPFRSFEDFQGRVPAKNVNKSAKKALAGSGAFDCWGMRRMMTDVEKAANEEAYIGVKLSGKSDSDVYAELIESTIHTEEEFDEAPHGTFLCLGGEIIGVKDTRTKARGEEMGFVSLAYGSDTFRVTCFPPVWSLYSQLFVTGKIVFFEGRKEISDQYGPGFVAAECIDLPSLVARKS